MQHGAVEVAEKLAIDMLELSPSYTPALAVLFQVRKSIGPASAAVILIRRLVSLDPNNVWATQELSMMLLTQGQVIEAERHARNAVRIAPDSHDAHNLLGMVMTEAEKAHAGEYHYRQAMRLTNSPDHLLLANLAWNLKLQGRLEEARDMYRLADASGPPVAQTLLGWARTEEADRNLDAATELLDRAEALAPDTPSVAIARAVTLERMGRPDAALAMLDRVASLSRHGLGAAELLAKGRLLDQLGQFDEAWVAYSEGKRRARATIGHAYLAQAAKQQADRLRSFFTAGRLATLPRGTPREDVAQPLFVLGFPRSGTTLVEQMLSAHPNILAGDELPIIGEITEAMPRLLESPLRYPEALAELWMGDGRDGLNTLRDHYFRRARHLGAVRDDAKLFTDKMPLNETHLGLIALIFPNAPLIHVLRHPLDVMLSACANHFTHGFHCGLELSSLAQHLLLVHDLVAHYRSQMPLRYLPVRYEDIVERQEAGVRAMLGFAGEDFDERCLAFESNRRHARTPSYAQVAEKLHGRSRYRYKNYLRHLEPVLPTLAPLIEKLGYSI